MKQTLILHDLTRADADSLLPPPSAQTVHFPAAPSVQGCIGCFGCWLKTPGQCTLPDRGRALAGLIPACDVFVIVSRCVYGGLSPDIKALIDRSIGMILPFFRVIQGEMHHVPRYRRRPSMKYLFYGDDITEPEREIAGRLAEANALNFSAPALEVHFSASPGGLREALK